jgi:putative DNA methylase
MIPKECKRLAEVDFPIAVVSKHAAREKSIRHGHPSTLHLWWARRPLAACRAMLLGLLLPDPCDEHCPEEFKQKARELLPEVQGQVGSKDEELRTSLLKFIGDFANWDLSSDRTYLEVSRGLVKAAHPEETPLVVDPFAGGGSIPLEALRLGCEAFASDLNPVACLILKGMLEDIPRHGRNLVEELQRVGADIGAAAHEYLLEFYPPDRDGARPIAYLWARTVRCEQPVCGAEIPLARSFWLCRKSNRKRALRYSRINQTRNDMPPRIQFEIFEPKTDSEVPKGTVKQARAICPCCHIVLPPDRVRFQLREQKGGADILLDENNKRIGGATLLAVVASKPNQDRRHYRLPTSADYDCIGSAMRRLTELANQNYPNGLSIVPSESLPTPLGTEFHHGDPYFNFIPVLNYGMTLHANLFTARQKLALCKLGSLVATLDRDDTLGKALKEFMGIVVSRCSDYNSSFARWVTGGEFVAGTFGRQALPPVWDFCETFPLSEESGGYSGALNWVIKVVERLARSSIALGQTSLEDASASPLPDDSVDIWFTDPPYYDAVPYAALSDFFFVWLKRTLARHPLLKDPFNPNNPLTPKDQEIIDTLELLRAAPKETAKAAGIPIKNGSDFEKDIAKALREGRRILKNDGIGSIVFAHKTTEGWEALLSSIVNADWVITASWPIVTERPGRLRSQESAALSASVHLVCRPRSDDATIGDWSEVHRELPRRVAEWMERLQSEHIRGADLVFACIGPALEIYSRYSKVVDAEDREIPLGGDPEATEPYKRGYLAYVWEAVGRAALEQVLGTAEASARNGTAGALEEDARLTALFLWTLQSTNGEENKLKGKSKKEKGEEIEDEEPEDEEDAEETTSKGKKKKGLTLVFDVVRRFAQPLGIHLDNWEDRIIETEKGIVRLLPVGERGAQLFGQEGADLVADRLEREPSGALQLGLFPDRAEGAPQVKSKKAKGKKGADKDLRTNTEATTLDRVHAAMLLQASGRTNGLRALLKTEQERGPDFLRLANALSALYPKESEEKRLLDAMLLAVPK